MTRLEMIKRRLARLGVAPALSLLLLFGASLTVGGCFEEPLPECAFACGPEGECPEDYRCVRDGWCKRNDIPFSYMCSPDSLIDASTFDSARSDAAPPDADPADADPSS